MGNYKDMILFVESLIRRKKPFLIIKYANVFCDIANNSYEIVTIGSRKLCYTPIDRVDAIKAIRKFELPMLYSMDSRNTIWGTEEFKIQYNKKRVQI